MAQALAAIAAIGATTVRTRYVYLFNDSDFVLNLNFRPRGFNEVTSASDVYYQRWYGSIPMGLDLNIGFSAQIVSDRQHWL